MHRSQWFHRQRRRALLAASLGGLLGSPGLGWTASAVITALPEAVVTGPSIQLSDVAQVESDDADLVARLQRVPLGQAPPREVERLLARSTLVIQAKRQGFALETLQFQGAQQVRVSRAAQRLTPPQLEAVVRRTLVQRLQQLAPSATIRELRGLDTVSIPPGPVHYEVLTSSRAPRAGWMPFTLVISVAGKAERQLNGTAYLTQPQEATRQEAQPPQTAEPALSTLPVTTDGRTSLTKQSLLMPRPAAPGPSVRRGDVVHIVSEASLIKVSAPGEALESGRVGDTIRVKNTATNREVRAQIIDQQTVRVSL